MGYFPTSGVLETVGSVAGPALQIIQDPGLPKILKLVEELNQIEQTHPSTEVRVQGRVPGIGLNAAVTPMKLWVEYRRNPVLGWIAIAAVLAIPFAVGYIAGRR